jgi:vacuolar protein sorting-associated protein 54
MNLAETDILSRVYLAISTLLQPPIVRTGIVPHTAVTSSGYKPPSTKDIPPVTLTNIPHVESKAFQQYLSQVGSLYDAFQRAKEGSEESESQLVRGNKAGVTKSDEFDSLSPRSLERRYSGVSVSSRSTSPFDARGRRSYSGRTRGHQAVTPLSTIPNVYFEEDFHLENPRTFDVVSERSEVVRQPSKPPVPEKTANGAAVEPAHTGRKALATNAILQEKLSWYMDTVEIHLISSISTASKSFFTALASLRELHAEAADSVKRIQILRKDLSKIDKEMAMGGLKVVKLRRRRENIRKLSDAVAQLREVVESVAECEEMVEKGEIEEALEALDEVERLMAGKQVPRRRRQSDGAQEERKQAVDLRGLKALQGASENLAQIRQRIGMGYETRFLDDLLSDLRRHVSSVSSDVTLQRWGTSFQRARGGHRSAPSISPAYMSFNEQLRSKLYGELMGLGRAHYTMPAATSFKAAVLREMKGLIRRHLPSSNEDDNESVVSASTHGGRPLSQQEKSSILARNLRALDAVDAYDMLKQIYTGVSESLRRLGVQVKVLLDITSGLGTQLSSAGIRSPSRSPDSQIMDGRAADVAAAQEEILQVLDMSSLLGQAVDIVQSQIVKVLKVRSEQTSHLPLEDFLRYFSLNRLFADECEAISGRSGTALKTVVDHQIRDFVVRFSDSQRHRIVEVMDSDKWDAKDFGDGENATLSRILRASTADVDTWLQPSKIWLRPGDSPAEAAPENGTAVNGSGKDKVRTATFDEQRYILPESGLTIMKSIEEFEYLTANIPSMTQEIGSNLVECLKLFNSRSSQLILGAGATRSAGLKNITTKHLALSSQALSFIVALIPYVREFVRRHSSSNQLMAEFDKVKRLCQEHQNGIHEKLVDIMSTHSASHVAAMKKIDWEAERNSGAVSGYMETLTKETATLHRVLARHFPDTTLMMIMNPVFTKYKEQWTKAFQEAMVKSETGRQR